MIRRDTSLDADRPHFYSQFWIDVAAGTREIGARSAPAIEAPEATEELEDEEPELPAPKPVRPAKPAKPEPKRPEPARSALTSLADLAKIDSLMKSSAEMDSDTVPDIERAVGAGADADGAIITDFDADTFAEPVEDVEGVEAGAGPGEIAEEYEDEEEWDDEEETPRRGSKPNKRRREPRRDF